MSDSKEKKVLTLKELYMNWDKSEFSPQPNLDKIEFYDATSDVLVGCKQENVVIKSNSVVLGVVFAFFRDETGFKWAENKMCILEKVKPRILRYLILYAHFQQEFTLENASPEEVVQLLEAADFLQSSDLLACVKETLLPEAVRSQNEVLEEFKSIYDMNRAQIAFWTELMKSVCRRKPYFFAKPVEVFIRSSPWKFRGLEDNFSGFEEFEEYGVRRESPIVGAAQLKGSFKHGHYVEMIFSHNSSDWVFSFGDYKFQGSQLGQLTHDDFLVVEFSDSQLRLFKNQEVLAEMEVDTLSNSSLIFKVNWGKVGGLLQFFNSDEKYVKDYYNEE